MSDKIRDFDSEAKFWDENPGRVKMARSVADSIKANTLITDQLNVLDFGCGTGLLTLQFQPLVKTITGADSSQGMLDILASKIENLGFDNVGIVYMENGDTGRLTGNYDLIISSMTFHHVKDTAPLLRKFNEILKPGGTLCVADLDPDDGLFHSDNTGVYHYGFEREKLKVEFTGAGFSNVKDVTAAEVIKPVPGGGERSFSLFLITGTKG
ncbi:MAG TPA: class I SAM-dependent methyltransferase [Spirochaetota bacterium]|nr:class I SAM-dependent methyltransferase [Spirochaetota bacterium]HPF06168.1 class I SAM-dependent methyltransferase [Spirochaetota bacterium]HPJ42673.1 class I SAM-dependent methyltransferase [Spirochaetota bacterium]HRX47655.1 class I SAM-dependent methyltransferase [Spirochaetota bacterium]